MQLPLPTSKSTAIFLLPGSFSPLPFWSRVIPYLILSGHETYALPLLSCGKRGIQGPASMEEDAEFIHARIEEVLDGGKDVLVVMSSYGGFPGSEACRGLGVEKRKREGKERGVVGLVYVASLLPPVGMSNADLMGDKMPPFVLEATDYIHLPPSFDGSLVFPELPTTERLALARAMPCHSKLSFYGKLTYPAYLQFPVTYLMPSNDMMIPVAAQEMMIRMAREKGARIQVERCESGHAPMFSVPERVAEVILGAVASSAAKSSTSE